MLLQKFALGILIWLPAVINAVEIPMIYTNVTAPPPRRLPPGRYPIPCLTRSPPYATIEEVVECFDSFTVPENAYSESAYNAAQPQDPLTTSGEYWMWKLAVYELLRVNGNCGPGLLPPLLSNIYRISLFTEAHGRPFCILSEKYFRIPGGFNDRGWGLMVVPATNAAVSRHIHISAPHPGDADPNTPRYAAAAFKNTGAKSLLISGRHRDAFPFNDPNENSKGCVRGPEEYSRTDAAHDTSEPFWNALLQIRYWQNFLHGCDIHKCAYIQIHRQVRCSDDIYVSGGLGKTTVSRNWYDTHDSAAKAVYLRLKAIFSTWVVSMPLPLDMSTCEFLTATDNVFGRLLNGIPENRVCLDHASPGPLMSGQFVHIEQKEGRLEPAWYDLFATSINQAMGVTCDGTMTRNPSTGLCH